MNAPKILLSLTRTACTLLAADPAHSVFQLRLVEDQAGKDTEEMTMVHPVDGRLLMVPRIHMGIPGGKAVIAGSFSEQEATEFAAKINAAIER